MIELINRGYQHLSWKLARKTVEGILHLLLPTITLLLAGLWRATRTKSPECLNFMNRKDHRFAELNGALQSLWYFSTLSTSAQKPGTIWDISYQLSF